MDQMVAALGAGANPRLFLCLLGILNRFYAVAEFGLDLFAFGDRLRRADLGVAEILFLPGQERTLAHFIRACRVRGRAAQSQCEEYKK
jgi:hypothetical protein